MRAFFRPLEVCYGTKGANISGIQNKYGLLSTLRVCIIVGARGMCVCMVEEENGTNGKNRNSFFQILNLVETDVGRPTDNIRKYRQDTYNSSTPSEN